MMIKPRRSVAPAEALLSIDDVKQHIVVSEGDDDALIEAKIAAVEDRLDGYSGILGRALVAQTWQQDFPSFTVEMELALAPLIDVVSVTYFDVSGDPQTVASGDYHHFEGARAPVVLPVPGKSWPTAQARPDAVTITYQTGYGAASDVPHSIRQAAKMMVGSLYENREDHAPLALHALPVGARSFLFPFMRKGF